MVMTNLLGDLATEAKLEAVRVLLAGAATDAKLEAVRALLEGTLATSSISPALAYTATPINITANMANGTAPLLAANPARRAVQFGAPANFQLALAASQTGGLRVYAGRDSLVGAECPLGALYLVSGSGLVAGNILTVWEA